MADRSVTVYLKASVADFNRQMESASKSATKPGRTAKDSSNEATTALGRLTQSATQNREAWDRAGTTLTAFGVGTVAALGFSAKAAINWESAWAGVTKTVDGSSTQMAALEDGLRGLARTLPASHQEIAAVAEAAGQLGIETDNVLSFTKTMIDLGETTNLSASEAATAIARFTNVMKTPQADVNRLGSSVVALGNNFATTEAEIIEMGQRLSAAGAIAGFTEPQVLGLATAMSSIGIEAEAGGSAMSQVIQSISKAVASGGQDVETFAKLAGMSAANFTAAWKSDPIVALDAVVAGLANMNTSGQNSYGVLEELGLSGIRQTAVLQGLATATGLTTEAVGMATEAWADNTALVEEAEKRYDTAESKIKVAWNSIKDAAISAGESLLPVIAGIADVIAEVAGWFGGLPAPIQNAATALGVLTGFLGLAAGGFLHLIPRVKTGIEAFRVIKTAIQGMGTVGKTATASLGALGLALAAGAAIFSYFSSKTAEAKARTEELADTFDETGARTNETIRAINNVLAKKEMAGGLFSKEDISIIEVADRMGIAISDLTGYVLGEADAVERVNTTADEYRRSHGAMWETADANRAEELVKILNEEANSLSDAERLAGYLADTNEAAGVATDDLTDATESLTEAQSLAAAATEEASATMDKWRESVANSFASFIDGQDAYNSAIEASREWAEAQAEATETADDSWEDFYDGVSVSAEQYIAQLQEQVAAQENWQANITDLTVRTANAMTGDMEMAARAMIDELTALGPAGADQVALLASMTDAELTQVVELWSRKGVDAASEFIGGLETVRNPEITVRANTDLATEELAGVLSVIDTSSGTVTVEGEDGPVETALTGAVAKIDEATGTVTIYGEDGEAVTTLTDFTAEVDSTGGTVTISGNDAEGRATTTTLTDWINAEGAAVRVDAKTSAAEAAMRTFEEYWNGRKITISVAANTYSASGGMPGGGTATRPPGAATGGAIFGPGTETSDSILYRLSHNEHVWSAAEVRGAGGHAQVAAMRAAARAHTMPGFANGGSPAYTAGVPAIGTSAVSVTVPDTVSLSPSSIHAVAQVVLTGARDVSAMALDNADRAARGTRQTRSVVR